MLWVISDWSLSALWLLSECSLSAHWLLTYSWLIAWRFEPEWWILSALEHIVPNGRTDGHCDSLGSLTEPKRFTQSIVHWYFYFISDILNESKLFKSVSEIIHGLYINYCGDEECKSPIFLSDALDMKVNLIYPTFKLSFLIPIPNDAKTISEFGVSLNPNFSYQVNIFLYLLYHNSESKHEEKTCF